MASSARIDELRKKFDENPRRYFAPLANEYRKAGDLEQAIFICQEYLPQQPGHMSGHIVYGQALFELARFDEARAVFETALSLDPENLIALRHLGDIARQAGDLRGARAWYQRVLEADPRNEEIAQIMLTVLTTPAEARPAIPIGHTPLDNPAVPEPAIVIDAEPPIDRSAAVGGLSVGPVLSELPERQPEPEPIRRSPEEIPEDELLDLNDFSVGDIPMAALAAPPVEETPAEPFVEAIPAFASVPEVPEVPEAFEVPEVPNLDEVQTAVTAEMEIERSEDAPSFEADPYAMAATPSTPLEPLRDEEQESDEPPPLPMEAFAADIRLELPDDGSDAAQVATADALDGLESYSEPAYGLSVGEPTASMEVESFFAVPAVPAQPPVEDVLPDAAEEPSAEPAWEPTPDAAAPVVDEFAVPTLAEPESFESAPIQDLSSESANEEPLEESPEAFVTETMAELYLQQGHLEAALDIYQRLADQRPADEYLRERIAAVVEAIDAASAATPAATSAVEEAPAFENTDDEFAAGDDAGDDALFAGPTIREFLSGLFLSRSSASSVDVIESPTAAAPGAFAEDEVFDTSSYGDAARLPETPAYETPAYGMSAFAATPAYGATPAFSATPAFAEPAIEPTPAYAIDAMPSLPVEDSAVVESPIADAPIPEALPVAEPAFDASVFDVPAFEAPTFDESPYEATTLEIDVSDTSFQVFETPSIELEASNDSIDEEFGVDTNEWQSGSFTPIIDEPTSVEEPTVAAAPASEPEPALDVESAPAQVVAEEAPPIASRPTPSSSETVTGSIDALFSGADASSVDSTAASTLAQAFAAEVPETPPLQGMPAHRATDELSLDHVFRSNAAPRQESEGEGFSFDQFFADDMTESAPKASEPSSSAARGGSDDIAQFNNWLNGLKKT